MLSTNLAAFMDLILYRPDSSRECLLFMDLRSPNDPNLMKDIIEQSFSAWKENADSILSFDPFHPEVDGKPASTVVENRKQAPFFGGAAFIHPVGPSYGFIYSIKFSMLPKTSENQQARTSLLGARECQCKILVVRQRIQNVSSLRWNFADRSFCKHDYNNVIVLLKLAIV